MSALFRFEDGRDAARDLEGEEDREAAPRYRKAPAPGKRPLTARVYRHAEGADRAPGTHAAEALERAAVGGGSPLPDQLRAMLERALGVSLGGVRVHTAPASAEAAEAIHARAYTVGDHIHFARGTYAPDDPEGQRLIAHEVAHAVQHGGGGAVAPASGEVDLELSQPGDAAEAEADRFADQFVAGRAAVPVAASPARAAVVHRDKDPAAPANEENRIALEKIQGLGFPALFHALRAVKPAAAKTDEVAGRAAGGPRLVLAQRAVAHSGQWLEFVSAQQSFLAGYPSDWVSDVMAFLGAPKGARYYAASEFDGQFDGLVDPAGGTLTLYWRAKVQPGPGATFGPTDPAPEPDQPDPGKQTDRQKKQKAQHDAWQKETAAAMEKFKKDLPGAIEKTWHATIRPVHKVDGLTALRCGVKVTVVDTGEHKVINVLPDVPGARSRMGKKKDEDGTFREEANKEHNGEVPVSNARGGLAGTMKVRQSGSAHEFGHAVGLGHPRCDEDTDRCYGLMPDEKSSVMGYGDQINKAKNGHSDFKPFIRVAEKWGDEVAFVGPLKGKNQWTPG